MFKRLIAPLFILFLSVSLLSASQQSVQEYLRYLEQITADIQKTQVQIEVVIPFREGYPGSLLGSGTVIAKTNLEISSVSGIKTENIVYFIHTNSHIVNEIEIVLAKYKEAGIRIYIIGKEDRRAEAEIVAWNWSVESLSLRAVISYEELEDFKFEVAKISNRLPISTEERRYSDNLFADFVYAGGYPRGELADSCGKVTQYVENELIHTRLYSFRLLKTMHAAFGGLIGRGQSGGGIFMVNEKTGKPEWVGTTTLGLDLDQLTIAIPVDVIVERFLKEIPDLRGLIDFPKFKLDPRLGRSKTIVYGDIFKKEKDNN